MSCGGITYSYRGRYEYVMPRGYVAGRSLVLALVAVLGDGDQRLWSPSAVFAVLVLRGSLFLSRKVDAVPVFSWGAAGIGVGFLCGHFVGGICC